METGGHRSPRLGWAGSLAGRKQSQCYAGGTRERTKTAGRFVPMGSSKPGRHSSQPNRRLSTFAAGRGGDGLWRPGNKQFPRGGHKKLLRAGRGPAWASGRQNLTARMPAASAGEVGVPNSRTADRRAEKQKPHRATAGPGGRRSEPVRAPPRRDDAERPRNCIQWRAWRMLRGPRRVAERRYCAQKGYPILGQFPASKAKRRRFVAVPPGAENEPSRPPARTTRWHGISKGTRLAAMQLPTARAAPGCPALAASSP